MINIYVCEDQVSFRNSLVKMINEHIDAASYKMRIALETENPCSLLEHLQENQSKNLYFLDIQLNHALNGIELAKEIRKYDQEGLIIFITSHGEMAYLTFEYKVKAFDYIVKDDLLHLKERLQTCLDNVQANLLQKDSLKERTFCVKLSERQVFVPYEEIMFFETSATAHKVKLNGLRQ